MAAILVLTQQYDATADLVIDGLNQLGLEVARFNTGDFPTASSLDARAEAGVYGGTLTYRGRRLALEDVRAVYYRRPDQFAIAADVRGSYREFALNETRMGLGGVLRALPCFWLSHPDAIVRAQYKPAQLADAARLGLEVPRTLITNDPEAARGFVAEQHTGAIYKAMSIPIVHGEDGQARSIMTSAVTDDDLARADAIRIAPCLLQERLVKRWEYRITVVGDRCFVSRLDSQRSAETALDFRRGFAGLPCVPATLPPETLESCRRLVRHYGLQYGAIDMVETTDGRLVFLEINPNGQWAWLDRDTVSRIRLEIVRLLAAAFVPLNADRVTEVA